MKILKILFFFISVHPLVSQKILLSDRDSRQSELQSRKSIYFDQVLLDSTQLDNLTIEVDGINYRLVNKDLVKNSLSSISNFNTDIFEGNEFVGQGRIFLKKDYLSGFFILRERTYSLKRIGDSYSWVMDTGNDSCGSNMEENSQKSGFLETKNKTAISENIMWNEPLFCDNLRIFNITIGFSPEAFTNRLSSDPNQLRARAQEIVASVNQNFEDSFLEIRARLVHTFVLDDPEIGIRDDDYAAMMATSDGQWDNLYDKKQRFKSGIVGVITDGGGGGKAASLGFPNFFIYQNTANMVSRGASHEIGHIFDCYHHRGSYSSAKRIILDPKQAYGFQGTAFKTIMVQTDEAGTSHLQYSDLSFNFPDGQVAGNDKAQAKLQIETGGALVSNYSPEQMLPEIVTLDYSLRHQSSTVIYARQSIVLNPGFGAELGSSFIMDIKDCLGPSDLNY